MQVLIEKELNTSDRILKPDCKNKTGRELLAFYMQTKLKQIFAHDRKNENPIFIEMNPNFISKFTRRLINNPQKRFLIGVTGESASGKSTICRILQNEIKRLDMPISVMSTDNYFNDISEQIEVYGGFDELVATGYDVDAPSSFQLDILKEDLSQLADGIDILTPEYLVNGTGVSVPKTIEVKSQKIIVVEGLATMYEDIKDLFDIKIYIESDPEIRKNWFIQRASSERNQSYENALNHWEYLKTVGHMYVLPHRNDADFVLSGSADLEYFAKVLEYFHTITNNFE
ncbi:MAG: hypothetical protein R3Y28_01170 [Candidatus Gastranaerophilales bacterium]